MPLSTGRDFAGYTIVSLLGTGGMGEVYLAQHPRLPRRDALKVLGSAVSGDDEFRQRFNQEAEMVATLSHPNIVTIHDRGECDGRLWIAMELVEGTDASRLLAERHRRGIPPAEVVRIISAVAEALDYAHHRQLLHRDIKPANILLGPDIETRHGEAGSQRVVLADFGVARRLGRTSDLTGTDMTIGTVTYAAPEQLKGEQIDGRADQYALAATAFHLLTGSAPYERGNPSAVISAHLSAPPPEIGAGHPDLARFGPVFVRALAKEPADRYESCRQFARALAEALGASADGVRRPRERRRGRWPVLAGAALVFTVAIGAAILLTGHHRTPSAPPPPPPAVSARMDLPVVVIGADCAVLGSAAVDEAGAPAYCARGLGGTTVWSVRPVGVGGTVRP